ncbi:xanthine dehydrogenase family protein molybdopterin-binding subunit [Pseudorhodoplanes sp.]|uniref:xanthine dehydrogenase family protein molybdopterin-binding subunit n=1 Tax=Pseudorhodoplanes sp. TaxID=1934341 RepID=UPI003D1285F6
MIRTSVRFGSDHGALRSEDEPLLTGRGQFTDDLHVPGQAYGVFVRATTAHARIRKVDVTRARAMPGVNAVFTGADLAADGLGGIPPVAGTVGRDGRPMVAAAMPVLAVDRIRFVGEAVAVVVAETLLQAQDAAEQVVLDLEELGCASDIESAMAEDAAPLHDNAPGNIALDWRDGNVAAVDAAFARAVHVERVRLDDTRLAAVSLEPRAGIGLWDENTGRYTLIATTQGVAVVRKLLAEGVFKVPLSDIRVLTYDIGGGFGMKAQTYPEYGAILYAARKTGRPVKWCNSRVESFLSDSHGRDGILEGEMAFDADGNILALRVCNRVGIGPYTTQYTAIFGTANTKNCLSSVYRIPAIQIDVKLVFTNAAPLGPYRGAGRPEAIYVIERLIDGAARKLGIDRVALRRRNFISSSAMPYQTAIGPIYDSGEFEASMDKALVISDWNGFPERRAESRKKGLLRGIGMCCFLEVAGGILNEKADLRFEADDSAAIRVGVQAMGQGHLTTFPRVIAKRLGIDIRKVKLIEGDSDEVPDGTPSVASRSLMMAGSASAIACDGAIEKGRRVASHLFEVSVNDVEFSDGTFLVTGTDLKIPILELAQRAREATDLPEELRGGLDTVGEFTSPQMSFPNGCHVCEIEVDPETGVVSVVRYTAVDDVGNIVHETVVDGQTHGGIVQGLGQVLGEHVRYGDDGQLLNASLMDYALPRAAEMPVMATAHHSVPCTTNPLGVKGAGESGVAGALPSAMNAVGDALALRGIDHFDLPASPQRVWQALQDVASPVA